ncbi:serine hydrolase domain-containing protein [Rahnella bonaserana]|jgi:CubicO group peptidase (beta-lactamase class C family)|uniref:Beta-lactamase family protein n=1 Tax=Rahnella bonaserana TaxID=2816248 RepID=A0ABS6LQF2_9GAMM|nr:serine hydrolase domain-containing protein [Rahnella bonaserana]MBU9853915.1 beta-lactamase family protein [Rahnella bonaserana]MCL9644367.1 beta-lactamase family protein [Rahnella victoriana]WHZ40891.1 serine hydrolase domain-containing protein [Rahnella bonaserana]
MSKPHRFIVLLPLFLTACGTLSDMHVDENPQDVKQLACTGDINAMVNGVAEKYLHKENASGLAIGIIRNDGVARTWGYGYTNAVNGYKIDGQTLFALGSVSKGVTGEVVAGLVAKGQLKWDDKLSDLLPKNIVLSDDAKNITLLQLATHTSGLPRQNMTKDMLESFLKYLYTGDNFYHELDSDDVLNDLSSFKKPQVLVPQYSNLGYALLGYILKLKTGEDIQQLAYDFIFDSLKMGNTSFYGSKLKAYPYRAIGHAGDQPKFIRRGEVVPDWSFNKNMVAAASLYSNVDDLLKYLRAHIDDSQPGELSAAIQVTEKVYYPRQIEAANIAWVTDTKSNQKMTYQVGYIGGYSSYIGFDKKHKNAVVVLQNTFNWSNYIGHDLLLKMAMADDYQGKCPDRENAHN